MKMTAPQSLTATKLRIILSVTIVLIILAGVGIFYLAYDRLGETATETGQSAASARESEDAIERLQLLQEELDTKEDIIDRASRVVANSQNYAYQDRLVSDLTIYANRANLSVRNISFSNQANTPTSPASPDSPGAAEGQANPGATSPGLKKATVDVALESPVNYRDLLNFLHYVEQNLTKLKISKVVMTKSQDNGVAIDVLNLEVHIR